MAQLKFKLWTDRARPFAGKMTVLLETEEEKEIMRVFKQHAGIRQTGARLDVVYAWPREGDADGTEQG